MDRTLHLLRCWAEISLLAPLAFLLALAGSTAFGEKPIGPIRIVAGEVPPQMDRGGNGRDSEIIRAALARAYPSKQVAFHVLPFSRHWQDFQSQSSEDPTSEHYDGVSTVPSQVTLTGFASETYIAYQNGIIYRAADFPQGLGDHPVEKLRGKRVVAFAGAAGILPDVQANLAGFRSYAEYDDQYAHSVLLSRGAADAVIADRSIIDFYNRQVRSADHKAYAGTLKFDPAFCPTPYHAVFAAEDMRDAFNRGLAMLRTEGQLEKIDRAIEDKIEIPQVPRPNLVCR